MKRFRDLAGGSSALARIKPPGPSYADWRRWIDDCIAERVIGIEVDKQGRPVRYVGVFAQAIAKRIAWLQDALQRGIPYQEAEAAFDAACDREKAQEYRAASRFDLAVAEAASSYAAERRAKKRRERRPVDGYAREMDDFADKAGL